MRTFSSASITVIAALTFATAGCSKVGEIKAQRSVKEANQAYAQQDYQKAAELYEQALAAKPDLNYAYFYLGNCYDLQYKPSHKGEAANDELLQKAVTNYQTAAERLSASSNPDEKKVGKLAMEYLVAAYGPDKLNDPAKAEPIVQKMIQLEPTEPTNYFQLAKIYEDAGLFDEAEKVYVMAKDAKPNDPTVYTSMAAFYNRQGEFDKLVDALRARTEKEPNNPEAFHTMASYYWDEATRDSRLNDKQKLDYVQKGLEADDKALQIKPDYVDAMVYKGLLLRLQANLEKDAGKQQQLLKQANELHDKAEDIKKRSATGASD